MNSLLTGQAVHGRRNPIPERNPSADQGQASPVADNLPMIRLRAAEEPRHDAPNAPFRMLRYPDANRRPAVSGPVGLASDTADPTAA